MTFEFLCAGLNFETSNLVTFWFSGSASETPGLVLSKAIRLIAFTSKVIAKIIASNIYNSSTI